MSPKITGLIGFIIGLVLGALALSLHDRGPAWNADLKDAHVAVLLNNGQAYFGKIQAESKGFVKLGEVFYVQARVNPQTKESPNILVKRGKEVHGPSFMLLNTAAIQSIEPVGADSQIAKLIADAKNKP